MNIQQLRYVVATAEHGTMTAAAEALHMAQPALSRAVRALEAELDVTLFARDGRRVRLTDEGNEALAIAEAVLADLDRLRSLGGHRALPVFATRGQARELGAPAVSHDAAAGRQVALTVLDSRDDVFEQVTRHRGSLGLTELPAPVELTSLTLGWQEMLLVHPPDLDLPEPAAVEQLSGLPLLAPPAGDWRRHVLVSSLRSSGVEPNIAVETADRDLVPQLVADGAGCTFLYGRQAARAVTFGARVTHLTPPPVREIGVVSVGPLTGRAERFVTTLRACAADVLLPPGHPRLTGAVRITGPMALHNPATGTSQD